MYVQTYQYTKLEPKEVESICLDVKNTNNTRFIVCVCDRSPSECKVGHFISSLSSAIELMYRSRNGILLLGDFNMDMYNNCKNNKAPNNSWNSIRDTVL